MSKVSDNRLRKLPNRQPDVRSAILDLGNGEVISWMEYHRRRLAYLKRCFDIHRSWLAPNQRALTLLRNARDLLIESDTFDDAITAIDEAIALVPVRTPCSRTAVWYWLGTAHLWYTTEELAELLDMVTTDVNKQIHRMHKHYQSALGRDEPCPCGLAYGHPMIDCH